MGKNLKLLLFILMGQFFSSCLIPNEKGKLSLNLSSSDQAARNKNTSSRASVNNVSLINDQIIITGSGLDQVLKVTASQSGLESKLAIIAQNTNELIISSSSQILLALNTLMSLTLEDAYGATVIQVTFEIPDSSVSTAKIGIDSMPSRSSNAST